MEQIQAIKLTESQLAALESKGTPEAKAVIMASQGKCAEEINEALFPEKEMAITISPQYLAGGWKTEYCSEY